MISNHSILLKRSPTTVDRFNLTSFNYKQAYFTSRKSLFNGKSLIRMPGFDLSWYTLSLFATSNTLLYDEKEMWLLIHPIHTEEIIV